MATMKRKYRSTVPSVRYIFKDGRTAAFISFAYYTDVESEITELDAEIKQRHPVFYIDENEREVDMDTLDPLADLKKQMKEEAKVELLRDMGVTETNEALAAKLKGIANTHTIAAAASASDSK